MWWTFFILFFLISIISTTILFYSLKRINQYENLIIQVEQIIRFSSKKLKQIDDKGTFESDDEVGFFFEQIKNIQLLLDNLFEMNENMGEDNANAGDEVE